MGSCVFWVEMYVRELEELEGGITNTNANRHKHEEREMVMRPMRGFRRYVLAKLWIIGIERAWLCED
jgi:hypothetical protein